MMVAVYTDLGQNTRACVRLPMTRGGSLGHEVWQEMGPEKALRVMTEMTCYMSLLLYRGCRVILASGS